MCEHRPNARCEEEEEEGEEEEEEEEEEERGRMGKKRRLIEHNYTTILLPVKAFHISQQRATRLTLAANMRSTSNAPTRGRKV